mmetsp:Transcript_19193/g.24905  ORF Transcript_19193/g.24905 Transcript_19193/m.24905 type:complete len:275 (-) Transcript_19193:167-991(-)
MSKFVRGVVEAYLNGHFEEAYYENAVRVTVSPDGIVSSTTKAMILSEEKEDRSDKSMDEIKEMMEEDTMASALVSYIVGDKVWTSILVLLLDNSKSKQWQIISDCRTWTAKAKAADMYMSTSTTSSDLAGVAAGADAYSAANLNANKEAMEKVFTQYSRLTFATDQGLTVIPANDFHNMVDNRWSSPKHAPYVHLQFDPRAAKVGAIQSISLASPRLALVKLRVAFAPVCYTDLLTFAKFSDSITGGDLPWRIIAKSSIHVPFLENEGQEESSS